VPHLVRLSHGSRLSHQERWRVGANSGFGGLSKSQVAYVHGDDCEIPELSRIDVEFRRHGGSCAQGGTLWGDEGSVSENNAIWVEFARSMPPIVGGAAQEIAEIACGDGQPWRVLDIAAGHGLFGIAIASRNPQASITALDWAAVLEVAKENAARAGVQDRVHTVAGSAFETDLASGYDVVLLTNFLHHFDRSTNVGLLKKVHAALKTGGRAMTLEFVPNPDRISPPVHATFSMMMLGHTRAGDAYTFAELESMFAEAEFASTTMQELRQSPERLLISRW
jgi:2-polyprenyl-3-methyl-5-hydroxy-6-metoxy-1,4-benzoquinol methylase